MIARDRLPNRRYHETVEFDHDGQHYVAGMGFYADGRLAELFLNAGKAGTAVETNARDAAILLSLALQHGVAPDEIRHTLTRDPRGRPLGPVGVLLDRLAAERAP